MRMDIKVHGLEARGPKLFWTQKLQTWIELRVNGALMGLEGLGQPRSLKSSYQVIHSTNSYTLSGFAKAS